MADTNEGVLDSTTDTSQDLALLNAEGNDSNDEKLTALRGGKESEESEEEKGGEEGESEEDKSGQETAGEDKDKEDEESGKRPPYDRPTMQELREEFPELFKKFPSLRDVYYREQEFSQIFPTVEDAREAAANAESFNDLSDKILSGESEDLFNAIKAADEKSFSKMASGILPTLYKISPDIHWQATLPLMQNLVRGFFLEGKKRGNENIQNSAEYLSDFIFGDISIARGEKNLIPERREESEESRQLKRDREEFETQRHTSFLTDVKGRVDNELRSIIDERGKVDPDKVFSDFIKDTIIGKVQAEVDKQLASDKAHMKFMNSLWERARKDGYSDEWKSRIQSAYLARAKSLVPAIRAKFVSEAQGTSSRVSERNKAIAEKNNSRREPGSGRATSQGNGKIDAKRVDWSKTSDVDLLNGNVTYKH